MRCFCWLLLVSGKLPVPDIVSFYDYESPVLSPDLRFHLRYLVILVPIPHKQNLPAVAASTVHQVECWHETRCRRLLVSQLSSLLSFSPPPPGVPWWSNVATDCVKRLAVKVLLAAVCRTSWTSPPTREDFGRKNNIGVKLTRCSGAKTLKNYIIYCLETQESLLVENVWRPTGTVYKPADVWTRCGAPTHVPAMRK